MASGREVAASTTAAERRAILAELEGSGLSIREFARQRRIPAGTISYWRHAHRRGVGRGRRKAEGGEDGGQRAARFVELQPVSDAAAGSGAIEEVFEVLLGNGRAVRVPPRFDEEALGRLLRVLEPPC